MTWTATTSSKTLTHTTTSRTVWTANSVLAPTNGRLSVQCNSYTDHIRFVCPASADGRTGWEIGIMNDAGCVNTNLSIRRIDMGLAELPVVQLAHGLAVGSPFTLEVEYQASVITARIVSAMNPISISYVNDVEPTFESFRKVHIASDVDGATAIDPVVQELYTGFAQVQDVLIAVGHDGAIYASYDTDNIVPLSSRKLGQSGQVSMDQYLNIVYAVGGGKAVKINTAARTVDSWTATFGSLPGYTTVGTTDAQLCVSWGTRVLLARSRSSPNVLFASAIDDPDDWDTGSSIFGAAFAISMPEPIVALVPVTDRQLLVCCERTTYSILGDPGLGASERIQVLGGTGASGMQSCVRELVPGGAYVHAPEGIYVVQGNAAMLLSKNTLTEYAEVDRSNLDDYTISSVRDHFNTRIHTFITPNDSTQQGVHLCYEESVGAFNGQNGGFYLDTFPALFGPTASCTHRGRIYLGGHDGVIRVFDVDQSTDAGQDIDVRLPVRVIVNGMTEGDVSLSRVMPQLTLDSEPVTVTLYGGETAEAVMEPSVRTQLWTTTYSHLNPPITRQGSDSALLLEFSGTEANWSLEQVDVVLGQGKRHTRRSRTAVVAGNACVFPEITTGTSPDPGGTGPGLPGQPPGQIGAGTPPAGGDGGAYFLDVFGGASNPFIYRNSFFLPFSGGFVGGGGGPGWGESGYSEGSNGINDFNSGFQYGGGMYGFVSVWGVDGSGDVTTVTVTGDSGFDTPIVTPYPPGES